MTRQRLHQLRRGLTQVKAGNEYRIEPVLRKGSDWWFNANGEIEYSESALARLKTPS